MSRSIRARGSEDLLLEGIGRKDPHGRSVCFACCLTAIAAIIMALILYTLTLDKIHSIAC